MNKDKYNLKSISNARMYDTLSSYSSFDIKSFDRDYASYTYISPLEKFSKYNNDTDQLSQYIYEKANLICNLKTVYAFDLDSNTSVGQFPAHWINFNMLIDSLSNAEIIKGFESKRHTGTKVEVYDAGYSLYDEYGY